MNIRERFIYIHIPKTGGTFILNTIFNKQNLQAEHNMVKSYNIKNKIIFTTIRDPINFYNSLYNFFKTPNHPINNTFKQFVQKHDNINDCIKIILSEKHKITDISSNFDRYYIRSENNYGLLTNYYLFFFNYEGGDINDFFKKIKQKVFFLKQENLKNETIDFCNKFNINYNKEKINKFINKNEYTQYVDEFTKKLILQKDCLIYKHFYS
tara:strand:+ start:954 stop:1583 length:630 start_codon:yes stop_codon:yes gene_type:complete